MLTTEDKKKRLKDLLRGLPRGTQARLAHHVGVTTGQVQNWLNKPGKWTSAENEQKIWQFFEQGQEGSKSPTYDLDTGVIEQQIESLQATLISALQDVQRMRLALGMRVKREQEGGKDAEKANDREGTEKGGMGHHAEAEGPNHPKARKKSNFD